MGSEGIRKQAPEAPAASSLASSSKACCSTTGFESSAKACSSLSPTAETCCSSSPGPQTHCPSPPKATKYQCDNSAPAPKTRCPSRTSTSSVQGHIAQRSSPLKDNQPSGNLQSLVLANVDIERNLVLERVTMHISGMTCTGCERKLQRVLSSITGVYNVKTSLVLGRAEFDVDAGISINEVALLVERQTEFRSTIHQGGHQLEVTWERPLALLLQSPAGPEYPLGVEGIQIVDSRGQEWKSGTTKRGLRKALDFELFVSKPNKYNARITYDPSIVGARDLLEKSFGTPLSLVPVNSAYATAADTDHLHQALYMTLFSTLLTIPVLIMAWAPLPSHKVAYGSSSLALATLVQFIVAGPFYPKALKALLFSGMIEMDLLIVISTTTAYVYSVVAFVYETNGQPLSTGEFFETSTLLVTLIMCGRLASAYARRKAANSIAVQTLQPSTAILSEDGSERLIDVREFQYGDLFKVLPDSAVPTDGIVTAGETEIDESMLTGEAIPVSKSSGSRVIAGSVNGPAPFLARLTKLPLDNTISKIATMVDEAKLSRPKVQETADRVASYFVPSILAITVFIFSVWVAVGIAVRGLSTSDAIVNAITYALAALIVSCPCAIGLAVPMVMVIASGVGAKHGVIFKSAEAIANARSTSHVVFDKTGTLTQGKLVVVEEIYRGEAQNRAASITQQLTSSSKHPVSQALSTHLESYSNVSEEVLSISSVIGKGMHGTLNGQRVQGGNPYYLDAAEDPDVHRLLSQGLTVFCLRHGSALLAIYGLRDALRTDAATVVSALQARNILVSIVSGDSITAVEQLALELGIPLTHVRGQCTPEDKARYVTSLSVASSGSKRKALATTSIFCGDGSNDAVALAQANIGIHMAGGTEVAKSAADVVLTQPSLAGILLLVDLSRASMWRVYLNFTWSVVYNLFAILLAAGAFVTVRIPPAYAGIGELVSVLPVIGVAMQLRWFESRF